MYLVLSINFSVVSAISMRHLDIRSGEHIGASPLTKKKVKPSKNSAICYHLLHCNLSPSFDNFSVLVHENKRVFIRNQRKPANHERQTIIK